MPVVAALGPIGMATLGAGVLGAGASIYAANTQAGAAKNALNLQQTMFDTGQANLAPYRQTGTNALGSINALYGYGPNGQAGQANQLAQIQASPDYQFALQQGQLGLDRSAASKGLLQSGGQTKDTLAFSQGLASQQFGNYFNRLMSIAGMGQASAANSANLAAGFGQTGGNTMQSIGAAQASGPVGAANALSTVPQNLLMAQYLGNNNSPSSYATGNGWGAPPSNPSQQYGGFSAAGPFTGGGA